MLAADILGRGVNRVDMAGIGEMLRRGREAAGLGREELARTIRISVSTVVSLEEERWDDLPRPVFVRGFVSSWARAVGIDEGAARDALLRSLGERGATPSQIPVVPEDTGITVGGRMPRRSMQLRGFHLVAAAVVVIGLAVVLFLFGGELYHAVTGPAAGVSAPAPSGDVLPGDGVCEPEPGCSLADPEAFGG